MFQYFKFLINPKEIWGDDYFHALARIKGLAVNQVRQMITFGGVRGEKGLRLSLYQRLKWSWVSYLRCRGVPYAYIFNYIDFLGQRFYIDKRVLIPRVETEELASLVVENILAQVKNDSVGKVKSLDKPIDKIRILDIGVGSGVLGLSVVKSLMDHFADKVVGLEVELVGIDKSKQAIAVAKQNKAKLFSSKFGKKQNNINIQFWVKDIFNPTVQAYLENNPFDFVLSNPPYIENHSYDLAKEVEKYEPSWALFGGSDGLDFYRHFASYGESWFRRGRGKWGCSLYLEVGWNQADKVKELFLKSQKNKFLNIKVIKDMFGKERFVWITYCSSD